MLFAELKQNLTQDFSPLPQRRLALLGDSATQFLARAIKAYGYGEKINFEVYEADFDQLNSEILDPNSELYHSQPEFIVLYLSAEKLLDRFAATAIGGREDFARQTLAEIENWWTAVARSSRRASTSSIRAGTDISCRSRWSSRRSAIAATTRGSSPPPGRS